MNGWGSISKCHICSPKFKVVYEYLCLLVLRTTSAVTCLLLTKESACRPHTTESLSTPLAL
jgi:hypothetical protein